MFARSVSIRLKPNTVAEFTQLIEKETLPLLRKQKGFQDEITFVVPDGQDAVGISLWGSQRERGSLRPRKLRRSPEVHEQSGRGNSSGSHL